MADPDPYPTWINYSGTPHAYLVGDSLTVGSIAAGLINFCKNATPMQALLVDCEKGRQIEEGVTSLGQLKYYGTLPNKVLVALGTNDSTVPEGKPIAQARAEFRAQLDRLMVWCGPLPRKVIIFDLYRKDDHAADAVQLNQEIYALDAAHANVSVAPWAYHAAQHPEWFEPDGVHMNGTGNDWRARWTTNLIAAA